MVKSEKHIILKQFNDLMQGFENPQHIERVLVTSVVYEVLKEHAGHFETEGYPRFTDTHDSIQLFYTFPDRDNLDVWIAEDDSLTAFFQDWQVVWKRPDERKLSIFEEFEKMMDEIPNPEDVQVVRVSPTLYRKLEQSIRMKETGIDKRLKPSFHEWIINYQYGGGFVPILADSKETLYQVVYKKKPEEVAYIGYKKPSKAERNYETEKVLMRLASPIPGYEEVDELTRTVYIHPYAPMIEKEKFIEHAKKALTRELIMDFEERVSPNGHFNGYHRDLLLLSPVSFRRDTPMEYVRRAAENPMVMPDEHLIGTMRVYRRIEVSHTFVEVAKPKEV